MKELINHLKSDWYKYGLEICVVIVGILAAFSLNNWKEDINDRKKERILLLSLKEDFESNKQLIKNGFEEQNLHIKILNLTLNWTGPHVELPETEILDSLDMLSYATIELVYGTINPIISTDQIELLKNNELRALLSSFPGVMSRYKEYEIVSRDLTIKQRNLHQKHIAILSMSPEFQTKKQILHESDYLAWLRDRDHQNILVDRIWQTKNAIDLLVVVNEENEKILGLINQELIRFD